VSEHPSQVERDRSAIRNYPHLLKRYARLLEVSVNLASTLDLDTLLQHVVEAAKELTECEATSLLLYDPGTRVTCILSGYRRLFTGSQRSSS
jgi:GAF domain-containing protein